MYGHSSNTFTFCSVQLNERFSILAVEAVSKRAQRLASG